MADINYYKLMQEVGKNRIFRSNYQVCRVEDINVGSVYARFRVRSPTEFGKMVLDYNGSFKVVKGPEKKGRRIYLKGEYYPPSLGEGMTLTPDLARKEEKRFLLEDLGVVSGDFGWVYNSFIVAQENLRKVLEEYSRRE